MSSSVLRRYTFKLYPDRLQQATLENQCRLLGALWNAALAQREQQWRLVCQRHGRSERRGLGLYDQSREIKDIRRECPEYLALPFDAMTATLRRLDTAFRAFFRRARAGGETPGYPRFRRSADYPGFNLPTAKNYQIAFRGAPETARSGSITWKGLPGLLRFRGRLPAAPERLKGCTVTRRAGDWWLSLICEMPRRRRAGQGTGEVVFDLVDEFARIRRADGGHVAGPEDVFATDEGRRTPYHQGVDATPPGATPEMGADRGQLGASLRDALPGATPEMGADRGAWVLGLLSWDPGATPEMGADRWVVRAEAAAKGPGATPEMGADRGEADFLAQPMLPGATPEMGADRGGLEEPGPALCPGATPEMGADRGPDGHAAIAVRPGATPEMGADRGESQRVADRAMSRCRRGSCRHRRRRLRKQRQQARAAGARREALHLWTTRVAAEFEDLVIVIPPLRQVTTSGRGDARDWGAAVALKAELNSRILQQGAGLAAALLDYKITEAGGHCERRTAEAPAAAIGNQVVAARKTARRTRRALETRKDKSRG